MRILAIEPYYGGSHKAFLDGWIDKSRHEWHVMGLSPHKWKWRMRGAAVTFAQRVNSLPAEKLDFDLIFCSSMLNLSEFLGLTRRRLAETPALLYFHENQITYPYRYEHERDYQFGITNITSTLAADFVWFNSKFHQKDFLEGGAKMLRKMPDNRFIWEFEEKMAQSSVEHLGTSIATYEHSNPKSDEPLRILWSARWEHDKNPEDFFAAIDILDKTDAAFELAVIGESFRDVPDIFADAKERYSDRITAWGHISDPAEYAQVLSKADVFVSTALHEFFGLGCVESALAGGYPLLPERLAYPELFRADVEENKRDFFYDGRPEMLAERLKYLAEAKKKGQLWCSGSPQRVKKLMNRFLWQNRAPELDDEIERLEEKSG
jgi:glycosyltransferase involved in cell wall biosynthesis